MRKMRFGDYIRRIRLRDSRELRQLDVARELNMSLTVYSDVENKRRDPFDPDQMERFIEFFDLAEDEKTQMYDLASYETHEIPIDLEDILMYQEVGTLARIALRQSKAGNITEEDWKRFIRESEKNKEQRERGEDIDKAENNKG